MLDLLVYFFRLLDVRRARQWGWLAAGAVVVAVVELVALGLLALFITSIAAFDQVMVSRYFIYAKSFMGDIFFNDAGVFYFSLGIITIFMMIIKNALSCIHCYATARLEGAVSADVGTKLLKTFLEVPYVWSSTQNSADVHSRIQWRLFVGNFPGHLMQILSEVVISLLLLASLFFFEPALALGVLMVLGGVSAAVFLLCRNKITHYGQASRTLNLVNSRECLRNVQGLREVKAFNAQAESLYPFEQHLRKYAQCTAMQKVFERAPVWGLEIIGVGGIITVSILMILSTDYSSARMMGTLSLVAVSAWRIIPSISRSVSVLGIVRGYIPYLQMVRKYVDAMADLHPNTSSIKPQELPLLRKCIELDGVEYRYERSTQAALSGINFCIGKGEMVGIVGRSGAGKSTLVDILTGLLEPTKGTMTVDGHLRDESTAKSWRDQLGLVPQSPYFFDGSLKSNIAMTFDDGQIDQERLLRSCRLAGVDDFIHELSDGLASSIGERANLLSGGQAQRVAIARALYRDPQLLILDEATSSLDDANEKAVRDTILGLKGERTIVVVAHRLLIVEQCDRLVWLNEGRIVASGPPEEILPRYAESERVAMHSRCEKRGEHEK